MNYVFSSCVSPVAHLKYLCTIKISGYVYCLNNISNHIFSGAQKEVKALLPIIAKEELAELAYESYMYFEENSSAFESFSPLNAALWSNQDAPMEILLKAGAKMEFFEMNGIPALLFATCIENEKMLSVMLENQNYWPEMDNGSDSPLHYAARIGNPEILKLLLDASTEEDTNETKTIALEIALTDTNIPAAEILIDYGADLWEIAYESFFNAIDWGYKETAQFILTKLFNKLEKEGKLTPLMKAAGQGAADKIKKIASTEDINAQQDSLYLLPYLFSPSSV